MRQCIDEEAFAQVALLLIEEIASEPTQSLLPGSTIELPKLTGINNQAIKLIESKQILSGPIYSLGLVELETPQTYVGINLANKFIRPSKSQRAEVHCL